MKAQGQKYLAELFGTFILVFVGCSVPVALFKLSHGQGGTLIYVWEFAPFAFGFAPSFARFAARSSFSNFASAFSAFSCSSDFGLGFQREQP